MPLKFPESYHQLFSRLMTHNCFQPLKYPALLPQTSCVSLSYALCHSYCTPSQSQFLDCISNSLGTPSTFQLTFTSHLIYWSLPCPLRYPNLPLRSNIRDRSTTIPGQLQWIRNIPSHKCHPVHCRFWKSHVFAFSVLAQQDSYHPITRYFESIPCYHWGYTKKPRWYQGEC